MKRKLLNLFATRRVLSVTVAVAVALSLVGVAWASGALPGSPEISAAAEGSIGVFASTPTTGSSTATTAASPVTMSTSDSDEDRDHPEDHEGETEALPGDLVPVTLPDGTEVATVVFGTDPDGNLTADVTAADGWTCEIKPEDNGGDDDDDSADHEESEIKVECTNGDGVKVEVKAELEDGAIWVKVKVEDDEDHEVDDHEVIADTPTVCEIDGVGTVTIEVVGGELTYSIATSWDYKVEEEGGHEIEIKFTNGDKKIEFKAEAEHGQIECKSKSSDDDHKDDDHKDDDHKDDDHKDGDDD